MCPTAGNNTFYLFISHVLERKKMFTEQAKSIYRLSMKAYLFS